MSLLSSLTYENPNNATKQYVDQTIASMPTKVFIAQATAPGDTNVLWVDTANSNIVKFWNGSEWATCTGCWG